MLWITTGDNLLTAFAGRCTVGLMLSKCKESCNTSGLSVIAIALQVVPTCTVTHATLLSASLQWLSISR